MDDIPAPEAIFWLSGQTALYLAPPGADIAPFLGQRIAHQPGDLRAHTRRILLAVRQQRGAEAFAALADLFIVTGPRGLALRQRLVAAARPVLSGKQQAFLAHHLATGLTATTPLPAGTRSRLTRGLTHGIPIVVRAAGNPPPP